MGPAPFVPHPELHPMLQRTRGHRHGRLPVSLVVNSSHNLYPHFDCRLDRVCQFRRLRRFRQTEPQIPARVHPGQDFRLGNRAEGQTAAWHPRKYTLSHSDKTILLEGPSKPHLRGRPPAKQHQNIHSQIWDRQNGHFTCERQERPKLNRLRRRGPPRLLSELPHDMCPPPSYNRTNPLPSSKRKMKTEKLPSRRALYVSLSRRPRQPGKRQQ